MAKTQEEKTKATWRATDPKKATMEELSIRSEMRETVLAILRYVRRRDWGEVAELDGKLKTMETKVVKVRKERTR